MVFEMTVLAKADIQARLTVSPPLIDPADQKSIQSASYDLRLGDEYYKDLKIRKFGDVDNERQTWIEIPAYGLVMVTTLEKVNMPKDLIARFGLRLAFVKRGLILQNEPQIDPGYQGRLACLLYNLSNQPVRITRGDTFATIEFEQTSQPAPLYSGPQADFDTLEQFFKDVRQTLPVSGLHQLSEEIKETKNRTERFVEITLLALTVMITLLSVIVFLVLKG
jgi:dCTP deaminase